MPADASPVVRLRLSTSPPLHGRLRVTLARQRQRHRQRHFPSLQPQHHSLPARSDAWTLDAQRGTSPPFSPPCPPLRASLITRHDSLSLRWTSHRPRIGGDREITASAFDRHLSPSLKPPIRDWKPSSQPSKPVCFAHDFLQALGVPSKCRTTEPRRGALTPQQLGRTDQTPRAGVTHTIKLACWRTTDRRQRNCVAIK